MRRGIVYFLLALMILGSGCGKSPVTQSSPASPPDPSPVTTDAGLTYPVPAVADGGSAGVAADAEPAQADAGLTKIMMFEGRGEINLRWGISRELQPHSQEVVLGEDNFEAQFIFGSNDAAAQARVEATPDKAATTRVSGRVVSVTSAGHWDQLLIAVTPTEGEAAKLHLRCVQTPEVRMSLAGAPHVLYESLGYNGFPRVAPGLQELTISFSKPVDRASVEAALLAGLESGRARTPNLEVPRLAFDWHDDQRLTVRFSLRSGQPGLFQFTVVGAHAQDGAFLADQFGLAFQAESRLRLWSWVPGEKAREIGVTTNFGRGAISPDGRFVALAGYTYVIYDASDTAAWLSSRDGTLRYLGPTADQLTWVSRGLLVQAYFGDPRLIPQSTLEGNDSGAAAQAVVPDDDRPVWWITAEPGGARLAYWLAWGDPNPRLDLLVVDPGGNWSSRDITAASEDRYGSQINETAAFGPDGALYWLERDAAANPVTLWRLTREGRKAMSLDVTHAADLQRAGNELAVVGADVLFNPETGTSRPLPLGQAGDQPRQFWFSADGRLAAVLCGSPAGKTQGYLYRLADLAEVGRWSGTGYGFDAKGIFYYGVPED
ncbi:MAG: hypothetical protein ACYC5Y_09620 [Symbiobacteriia bacterium]